MTKVPRGQTEERKAYMKAWHAANPRDRRAYKAAYDNANADKNRAYRESVKEQRRAYEAARYAKDPEAVKARAKAWTQANRDRWLAYHRQYHASNPEKVKAWARAWRAANRDKVATIFSRRRMRKAGNGGSHTTDQRREKFERLGNVCFYCKLPRRLTVDHDVPIVRGGTDDISNILPACRSCNSKKHVRTAAEFLAYLGTKVGGVESELRR